MAEGTHVRRRIVLVLAAGAVGAGAAAGYLFAIRKAAATRPSRPQQVAAEAHEAAELMEEFRKRLRQARPAVDDSGGRPAVGATAVTFEGNSGDSLENAIKILGAPSHSAGVRAEYDYLSDKFGVRDRDWTLKMQALLTQDGKKYDRMDIELSDGTRRTTYFDITEFFGRF